MRPKLYFRLITALFFIFPIVLLLLQSITTPWRTREGINIQLESFTVLWSDPNLWTATVWSIIIGAVVLLFNLFIGLTAGKALAFYSFKGRSLIEALLLSPLLIPLLAVAIGLHLFMIRLDLADTWLGVALVHLVPTVPYTIKIFHHAYSQIGRPLLEQAENLGASVSHQFFTVELPLLKNAIRSVTFLTIVISLSQYAITAIIGGGSVITMPMIFFPFLNSANPPLMAALSIWFAVPPLVMYIAVEALLSLAPYSPTFWRNRT
ncbi:ABC transporter permease [Halobacillus sp. A5]|uniref:ABC transporter permease n=1 Tax=Halobacillus sp. A5 TaxID=2880263 RepID=UPI0020A68E67|nr:ABC transporter permease subunit [Halobacillus sp. A5]MCP3029271.1 ABC transporter permease subunit [Halobacillus sp. A5]